MVKRSLDSALISRRWNRRGHAELTVPLVKIQIFTSNWLTLLPWLQLVWFNHPRPPVLTKALFVILSHFHLSPALCVFLSFPRAAWHTENARGRGGADQAHQGRPSLAARDADPAPHRDDDRQECDRTGKCERHFLEKMMRKKGSPKSMQSRDRSLALHISGRLQLSRLESNFICSEMRDIFVLGR